MADVHIIDHKTYYVTFDWYTPRPHFIILGQGTSDKHFLRSMRPSGQEMDHSEKQALMETAKGMHNILSKQGYVLPQIPNIDSPVVLSIHFGKWFGEKSKIFHAHICIDVSIYESWLTKYKDDPILKNKLKQTGKTYHTYLEMAKKPPKDYTADDMKTMKMVLGKQSHVVCDLTKLAYHQKHMRIGFISKSNDLSLLKEMDNFILRNNLHGGQICIDLSGSGFSGFKRLSNGDPVDKSDVQGYLQLPGDTFGMFLNVSKQGNAWMKNDHTNIGMIYT